MFEDLTKEDLTFLGYVELHCQTERALFSGNDVLRLYELAGVTPQEKIQMGEFYRMDDMYALPLIELARMKSPTSTLPQVQPDVLAWALFQGVRNAQKAVEWKMFAIFPDKAFAEVQSTRLSGLTRVVGCDLTGLKVRGLRKLRKGVYTEDPLFDFDISESD